MKALSPLQDSLRREINPVVMTTKKFAQLLRNKDRFAMRVLTEPKLFIKGNEDELAKPVQDRAAGKA